MPDARSSAWSPFASPLFRRVWIASTVSNVGGMIQSVGAAWMMLAMTASASMVALVQTSISLPVMLLSLVAGAVADNLDRRRILLASQLLMLFVSALLAIAAYAGVLTPWLLLAFTFLIGCGGAFNAPAWQASVGDMVPREELPGAIALNSMGFNIARSVGPAIGGAIVAAAGAALAFAINAASYVGLVVVLARWKPDVPEQPLPRESLAGAIVAGLRYVAMSPPILGVLARSMYFSIGASAVLALMPIVAADRLGGGPLTYGLLLGAFGAGAVAGAAFAARLRESLSTEGLVAAGCIGFAVAAIVTGVSDARLVTMAGLLVGGATWVLTLSTFNVAVQLATPRWVVARALSIYQMATFGGLAAGAWVWGRVAGEAGVAFALVAASVVLFSCAIVGTWRPLAQSEARNLDPLRAWHAPEVVVPVEGRTGPVVVTIEYRIRDEDVPEFLAAMAERRRIRRRDGAHDWAVLRDLAEPEVWIERYKTPTWTEYLRHTNRMTQDDAAVPARLRELHQGGEAPRVRRMIERPTDVMGTRTPGPRELAEPMTDPNRSA